MENNQKDQKSEFLEVAKHYAKVLSDVASADIDNKGVIVLACDNRVKANYVVAATGSKRILAGIARSCIKTSSIGDLFREMAN